MQFLLNQDEVENQVEENNNDLEDAAAEDLVGPQGNPFRLSPALVSQNILDCAQDPGKTICKPATKSSHSDSDDHCDGGGNNLSDFSFELEERAEEHGWTDGSILAINATGANPPVLVNLLNNCGILTHEQCELHVTMHINRENRNAQDDWMLHRCV